VSRRPRQIPRREEFASENSCRPRSCTTRTTPGFFEQVDKNRDGVVCLKDWTGPDPDPLIGFLVIDNTGRHNNLP